MSFAVSVLRSNATYLRDGPRLAFSFVRAIGVISQKTTMEVARRLIMIAIVASLQFAPTYGDIIVQPGYGEKSTSSAGKLVTPIQQQPKLTTTLNDEIERYRNLQQLLQAQIFHLMNNGQGQQLQQLQQLQQPSVLGLHPNLLGHPIYAGAHLHPLAYNGIGGLHHGGIQKSPFNLGPPSSLSNYVDANPEDDSTTDKSRVAAGLGETLDDVATQPAVEESKLDRVVELPVPENDLDESSIDEKQIEARHIGEPDDMVVGSPLDKIRYQQSDNQQYNFPINVEGKAMSIAIDRTMEHKIDDTIPIDANLKNNAKKDHEETNDKKKITDSVINAKIDKTSSENRAPPVKSQIGQQGNSKWTSKAWNQSWKKPPTFDNARIYQQTPWSSNGMMMKNWMTTPRHLHGVLHSSHLSDIDTGYPPRYLPGHQPIYPPVIQPSYPPVIQPNYPPTYQPGYQSGYQPLDYYGRPGTGNYQPSHGIGGSTSTSYATSGPTGSSASSSSTSNRNNEYNPYRSTVVKNPNVSWQPYSATRFVDQFGRAFIVARPLNSNPMIGNLNGYVKNTFEPQQGQIYEQPRYWYTV